MRDDLAHCYAVLELDPSATAAEIREAYLDLVKVWHPDRFQGEPPRLRRKAEAKIKAINDAYERLRSGAPAFLEDARGAANRPPPAADPGLRPQRFGSRWGYVNSDGKLVIQPRFDYAGPFSEGLAGVSEHGRCGFIDASGDYAVYPEFAAVQPYSEGLAPVLLTTRWGYIDRTGAFRINPLYEDCRPFSESAAAVKWRGRWGYIDRSGRFLIPARYEEALEFHDGWARVRVGDKWTRVNRQGEVYVDGEAARLGSGG